MSTLVFALCCFTLAAWGSTLLLGRKAIRRPYIGALVERALIALLISVYVTLGTLLTWNRETGYALFDIEIARSLFTANLFGLAMVPTLWLLLFGTNRLGRGE